MYKPDEDIDRLSREAAEHYNAPGAPSWDALRQTLDKEMPQEKKKRRGFLFFILLALGLSVAGSAIWYGASKSHGGSAEKPIASQPTDSENKPAPTAQPSAIQTDKPAATPASDQTTAKSNPNSTTQGTPVASERLSTTDQQTTASASAAVVTIAKNKKVQYVSIQPTPEARIANTKTGKNVVPAVNEQVSGERRNKIIPTISSPGNDRHTGSAVDQTPTDLNTNSDKRTTTKVPSKSKRKKSPANNVVSGSDNVNGSGVDSQDKEQTATNDNTSISDIGKNDKTVATGNTTSVPSQQVTDTTSSKAVAAVQKNDSAKPVVAKTKTKEKSSSNKAILLGITGGFDESTVKFTYGSNVGYNVGLSAGYQFSKHWAALTGVVYTKKNYKLNGSDYNPPKHYWTQYVDLQTVEGYCRMWEIPLVARYTFNPQSKTIFFASGGISSYFMKKQQYDYYYKTSAGVPMTMPWTNDSTFNHVFSILDLSAGVEKSVGKHMSLLIEPYAKIPLGGVGFGNIRLSSFGVNLTVQYRQLLKR